MPKRPTTIKRLAVDYINLHSKIENKRSSVKSIEQIVAKSIIPILGDKPCNRLTGFDIAYFKQVLQEKGLSNKSINNNLAVLRAMLMKASDAGDWNLMHRSSMPAIKAMSVSKKERHRLAPHEIRKLHQAARNDNTRPWPDMILVALQTGLRIGELRALQWGDINFESHLLHVRRAAWSWTNDIQTPKSNKTRKVPLNLSCVEVLRAMERVGPFVFSTDNNMLSYDRAIRAMRRVAAAATIPDCTWHTLRHTFATQALEHGIPVEKLQKILGHSEITTTMLYADITDESLVGSTEVLNQLARF